MTDIFSIKDFEMPKGFLWGSATAGHQIEGNNIHSDWWHNEAAGKFEEKSGSACNSYELYEEDSKLLKALGHQCYRMSIEWARIEPVEGELHIEEIDHYIKVFESLKSRNIQINLTMVHGTVPQWFKAKGGFSKKENVPYFEKYLEYVVPKIAQYIDFWCVYNEHNMWFDPSVFDFKYNSLFFHARGYHIIKKYSNKPISSAHAFIQYKAKRADDKFDVAAQSFCDVICNEYFFHAIRTGELVLPYRDATYDKELKDTCDYWAVNTYVHRSVDTRGSVMRGDRFSFNKLELLQNTRFYVDMLDPECIYQNLIRLKDKPVFITENGVSTEDDLDDFRIVWLAEYLAAVKDVMKEGVDVMGYLYWSLLDNYEWGSYTPKFGLVSVDRENGFKRTIKRSGYFFKELIEANGFKQEILRKYLQNAPKIHP